MKLLTLTFGLTALGMATASFAGSLALINTQQAAKIANKLVVKYPFLHYAQTQSDALKFLKSDHPNGLCCKLDDGKLGSQFGTHGVSTCVPKSCGS
jgi:hypothetical protein